MVNGESNVFFGKIIEVGSVSKINQFKVGVWLHPVSALKRIINQLKEAQNHTNILKEKKKQLVVVANTPWNFLVQLQNCLSN